MITIEDSDITIFANSVCKSVKAQLTEMATIGGYSDMRIRVMPNASRGYKSINGFTGILNGTINPALCGTDIGCGVLIQNLGPIKVDVTPLRNFLIDNVPTGPNIRTQCDDFSSPQLSQINIAAKNCLKNIYGWPDYIIRTRISKSIGTLGGGNHFIELDFDDATGNVYLVVHTGSRSFGKEATKQLNGLIHIYNKCGKNLYYQECPYWYMECLKWAELNRKFIAQMICDYLKVEPLSSLDVIHNSIGTITRKGAISANKGEECYILLDDNLGIIQCEGKGNEEWNYSAPAGMNPEMTLREFINLIRPTVKIKKILSPIFTYKPLID